MKSPLSNAAILRTTAPISLALFIPLLNNLTNNFFLGKAGERDLAVSGVSGIFYLILAMVGYGLSNGLQVQLSRREAQHDNEGAARLITNGGMLSLMLSLSLMILSLWLAPIIFGFSLRSDEHVLLSVHFLYIRVWGLPFLMLTQLSNAFYIATGRSKYLMAGSAVATGVNIVGDYILILGHFGFPKMGLAGAAIASVIAEICACGVMWGLFYKNHLYRRYPLARHWELDTALCKRILNVSAPLIVQYFFSIGGWQVFYIFVEHLGERELAASQILRSIFTIAGTITWAFAATCNSMVSYLIGGGRAHEVYALTGRIVKLSLSFTATLCVLMLLFGRYYLLLFTRDAALIDLALPSLHVIVVASLVMAVSTAVFNAVVGTGNTVINLSIEITCVGCYLVYCYIVIQRMRLPLYWAWGAEFVYWSSLLIAGSLYLRSGRWRGKVI